MSLPLPNLDDRTWRDLVDEAIDLIPRYCPEWTHVGPSDPGIVLLELYASMLEQVLFRLNRLPEKNHLALLSLVGVRRLPAQAARTLLTFEPSAGAHPVVPAQTRVSTSGADAVVFETTSEIQLQPLQLTALVSAAGDSFSDHAALLTGGAPETVFLGRRAAERFLMIDDRRLSLTRHGIPLELRLLPAPGSPALVGRLRVDAFDGGEWSEKDAVNGPSRHTIELDAGNGEPGVSSQGASGSGVPDGKSGGGIERLRLSAPEGENASELQLASVALRLAADEPGTGGTAPEHAFVGEDSYLFPVEPGRATAPFSEPPKPGAALHISHPDLMALPGTRLHVDIEMAESEDDRAANGSPKLPASSSGEAIRPVPPDSENATASSSPIHSNDDDEPPEVAWEVWNGRRWNEVGRTATGPSGKRGPWRFTDSTGGLRRHGTVSFDRPDALPELELGGVTGPWIRARLVSLPVDAVFPRLGSIQLRLSSDFESVAQLHRQHEAGTEPIEAENEDAAPFAPFAPADDALALHFGFDQAPRAGTFPLHLQIANEGSQDADIATLSWEAWNGTSWSLLEVEDGTSSFSRSGPVLLRIPALSPLAPRRLFHHDAHWIRARVESGAWLETPKVSGVFINSVEAVEGETLTVDFDSSGEPNLTLALPRAPVLSVDRVEIRTQTTDSSSSTLNALSATQSATWKRWKPVPDLYSSPPSATHCVVDPISGTVRFGDGHSGAIPPRGTASIRVTFWTGGGPQGNVGPGSLTVLRRSIPFVRAVSQPVAARGGANGETVDEVRNRAAQSLRSRDRAVTAEDFEVLAHEASREVARACCLPGKDGTTRVIIVPRIPRLDGVWAPSRALLDHVAAHLEERRLLTVRVTTNAPTFVRFSVATEVSLRPGASRDRVAAEVRRRLESWLHPLTGGARSDGWTFGRAVTNAELRNQVESVSGVDTVPELSILCDDGKSPRGRIDLMGDGLPRLAGVEVRIR